MKIFWEKTKKNWGVGATFAPPSALNRVNHVFLFVSFFIRLLGRWNRWWDRSKSSPKLSKPGYVMVFALESLRGWIVNKFFFLCCFYSNFLVEAVQRFYGTENKTRNQSHSDRFWCSFIPIILVTYLGVMSPLLLNYCSSGFSNRSLFLSWHRRRRTTGKIKHWIGSRGGGGSAEIESIILN